MGEHLYLDRVLYKRVPVCILVQVQSTVLNMVTTSTSTIKYRNTRTKVCCLFQRQVDLHLLHRTGQTMFSR